MSSFEYIEIANRTILNHGWVNFPIAYTQVATTAVYAYILASLFACQFLNPSDNHRDLEIFPTLDISFSKDDPYNKHTPDMKIPYFTIIEFISYVGWIKVAETLLNPFGDDDDDFQINYLIDRNVQVSYMIVDGAESEMELVATDPFLGNIYLFNICAILDINLFPFADEGIEIPAELPYKDDNLRDASGRDVVGVPDVDQGLVNRLKNITTHWRKISAASSANAKHLETVMEEKQDARSEIVNCSVGLCEVIALENDKPPVAS